MVVNFHRDPLKDRNLYSIDTGMNESRFQGHYFDMNQDHITGKLRKMKIGGRDLEGVAVKRLTLRHESKDPRR